MPVLDRVDPEYLPIINMVPIIDLADLAGARAALQAVFAAVGTAESNPAVSRSDHSTPGLPGEPEVAVRLFKPAGVTAPLPTLLWIQGGGYVLTAADPDEQWCETIAHDLQCAVISVIWRRAPEAPFPGAHADCYAALLWAAANAAALGLDPERLVVGGASSGGGAAAGVALRARDEGTVRIAHQLLLYPMLDDRDVSRSSGQVTDPELWNRKNNGIAWRAYLGESYGTDKVSPYAAPARTASVGGLPPTTILTGELDLFVDENIEYAQRLLAADVPTELHVYPSVHHGFDRHNPAGATAKRFLADRDHALARAFAIS
ncbi:alpha/beta hydrolase [soil metagenome]